MVRILASVRKEEKGVEGSKACEEGGRREEKYNKVRVEEEGGRKERRTKAERTTRLEEETRVAMWMRLVSRPREQNSCATINSHSMT